MRHHNARVLQPHSTVLLCLVFLLTISGPRFRTDAVFRDGCRFRVSCFQRLSRCTKRLIELEIREFLFFFCPT